MRRYKQKKKGYGRLLLLAIGLVLISACCNKIVKRHQPNISINLTKTLLPAKIFCASGQVIVIDKSGKVWQEE